MIIPPLSLGVLIEVVVIVTTILLFALAALSGERAIALGIVAIAATKL